MSIAGSVHGVLLDVVEALDQGLLIVDVHGRVSFANRKLGELFGLADTASLIGHSLSRLGSNANSGLNADAELFAYLDRQRQRDGVRAPVSVERERADGSMVGVSLKPMPGGGHALQFSDVTDQYKASARLQRANRATVVALANFAESRDSDTGTHVLRVARLTEEIARELHESDRYAEQMDRQLLESIAVASILHDVGKISTPDHILTKPGPLSVEERAIMEQHALAGASLLTEAMMLATDSPYLNIGVDIARSHHEKFDGTGYPERRKGQDIPLAARIVAVADVFDALTSKRPYKDPWPTERAVAMIGEGRGSQFDPAVVDAFAAVMDRRVTKRAIIWNPSMSVGDNRLDNEHMVLIDIINQLGVADNRRDRHIIEMAIDELISYANFHFRHEEEYMAKAGYPERDDHAGQHRAFTNKMLRVRDEFLSRHQTAVGDEILIFLRHWLTHHILIEDMGYRQYIAAHQTGVGIL